MNLKKSQIENTLEMMTDSTNFLGLDTEKVYYLASPYSVKSVDSNWMQMHGRRHRAETVEMVAAYLITKGFILIEPIGMSYTKAEKYKDQIHHGYTYWQTRDRKFVELSDAVIVVNMRGWGESAGVTDEIAYAKALGKKVYKLSLFNGESFDNNIRGILYNRVNEKQIFELEEKDFKIEVL